MAWEFKRLEGINLQDYQCETILLTHHAVVWMKTVELVRITRAFYISLVIRQTLCQNLETLIKTHKISKLALF